MVQQAAGSPCFPFKVEKTSLTFTSRANKRVLVRFLGYQLVHSRAFPRASTPRFNALFSSSLPYGPSSTTFPRIESADLGVDMVIRRLCNRKQRPDFELLKRQFSKRAPFGEIYGEAKRKPRSRPIRPIRPRPVQSFEAWCRSISSASAPRLVSTKTTQRPLGGSISLMTWHVFHFWGGTPGWFVVKGNQKENPIHFLGGPSMWTHTRVPSLVLKVVGEANQLATNPASDVDSKAQKNQPVRCARI